MTGSMTGTWKLVATTSQDADGRALPPPYGPQPMGLLTLTEGGRMLAVLCDGRAALPAGVRREHLSYGGLYRIDGSTLVTQVEVSSIARIAIGGEQVRKMHFEGDRLVLVPPPLSVDGVVHHRTLTWEKLSTQAA